MRCFNLTILFLLCFKLSAQLTHSHNDYEQKQPFYAAYHLGFDSIEADVYIKDNELFVAHDWDKISPDAVLLYLATTSKGNFKFKIVSSISASSCIIFSI